MRKFYDYNSKQILQDYKKYKKMGKDVKLYAVLEINDKKVM